MERKLMSSGEFQTSMSELCVVFHKVYKNELAAEYFKIFENVEEDILRKAFNTSKRELEHFPVPKVFNGIIQSVRMNSINETKENPHITIICKCGSTQVISKYSIGLNPLYPQFKIPDDTPIKCAAGYLNGCRIVVEAGYVRKFHNSKTCELDLSAVS